MIDPNKVMQDAEQADRIMQRQRAEIARLRQEKVEMLAAGDRLEGQLFSVAKQRDALRLTDAEREAIDAAAHAAAQLHAGPDGVALATTLRGLLERLGGSDAV